MTDKIIKRHVIANVMFQPDTRSSAEKRPGLGPRRENQTTGEELRGSAEADVSRKFFTNILE